MRCLEVKFYFKSFVFFFFENFFFLWSLVFSSCEMLRNFCCISFRYSSRTYMAKVTTWKRKRDSMIDSTTLKREDECIYRGNARHVQNCAEIATGKSSCWGYRYILVQSHSTLHLTARWSLISSRLDIGDRNWESFLKKLSNNIYDAVRCLGCASSEMYSE